MSAVPSLIVCECHANNAKYNASMFLPAVRFPMQNTATTQRKSNFISSSDKQKKLLVLVNVVSVIK